MSFTDEQLIQRLRNLATDHELSGLYITAKVLGEAAARLMTLSHVNTDWHPSLTSNHDKAVAEVVNMIIKNPWTGEIEDGI